MTRRGDLAAGAVIVLLVKAGLPQDGADELMPADGFTGDSILGVLASDLECFQPVGQPIKQSNVCNYGMDTVLNLTE